jgi:hypothetical protein
MPCEPLQACKKRAVAERQSLLLDACDSAFRTSLSSRPSAAPPSSSSTASDGPDSVTNKRHSRREFLRSSAIFANGHTRDGKIVISKTRRSGGQVGSRSSSLARGAAEVRGGLLADPLSMLTGSSPSCTMVPAELIPEGRNRDSYVTDVVNLYAQVPPQLLGLVSLSQPLTRRREPRPASAPGR